MGTVGTFDAFTTARLGVYAAYKGLSLTGNNIANINTPGYTRQVLDQVSLKTGANDMYRSQYDNHIGNGTLVTSINQIRDPYLDVRYRNTAADVGYYDETLNGLQQIASILDEVGKGEGDSEGDGMLYAQLQDLADSLRAISSDPCKDNDTLARTSADALVNLFNKYAEKLENLRLDYEDSLNQDVKTVNGILTNIRNLNESIRESDIHGDNALEMRDERNRQIDELSQYMHIKVSYTMESIGGGLEIERCTIALANANPDPDVKTDSSLLIDGIYGTQIDIPDELTATNPNYSVAAEASNNNKLAAAENPDEVELDPDGFRYIKKSEYGVGLNPKYNQKDPNSVKYYQLDKNGNLTDTPAKLTDKLEEAATLDNRNNYIITLDKLRDAGGNEWTKPTTTWDIVDGNVGVKAKYTYAISKTENWSAGDKIQLLGPDGNPVLDKDGNQIVITVTGNKQPDDGTDEGDGTEPGGTEPGGTEPGGTEPGGTELGGTEPGGVTDDGPTGIAETDGDETGGDGAGGDEAGGDVAGGDVAGTTGLSITVREANSPGKLAAAIAAALDGTEAYKGYDVRSNGRTIIFTAQNPGEIKEDADKGVPTKAPELKLGLVDAGSGSVSFVDEKPTLVRAGVDREYPKDYHDGTEVTWNPNGSKTEVTYLVGENNWMKCIVTTEYTYDVTLDDNDLHGSLQATRELLTESGEFATNATIANVDESAKTKRGIPYYQESLNLLARQFAEQYNSLNQGYMVNEKGNYIDKSGEELKLAGEAISKTKGLTEAQKKALGENVDLNTWLGKNHAKEPEGMGVLFSNRGDLDDTDGITAANISISASWSGGSVKIVPTMVELFGKNPQYVYDENGEVVKDENGEPLTNTTQNENVNHMISLVNASLIYDPRSMVDGAAGTTLFKGSFNDMFSNINIVLGNDERKTSIKLDSQYTSLVEIDSDREGVSGVDLNDEAMNMMQYQKAYSAACRLMTAIDEALERLINNTGIAGR